MEAIETVLIAIVALEMLDICQALIFWPMKPIMRAPAAGIAFRLGATAAMVLGMPARAAEPAALPAAKSETAMPQQVERASAEDCAIIVEIGKGQDELRCDAT
ncbi:MAG: hypothetical protein USCAAHI_02595 [Beijerinckiaceae bacterium]|nr:MAG: hypothetical protein USCAAHI_02595 [Beijerinckiaceae bacterium]